MRCVARRVEHEELGAPELRQPAVRVARVGVQPRRHACRPQKELEERRRHLPVPRAAGRGAHAAQQLRVDLRSAVQRTGTGSRVSAQGAVEPAAPAPVAHLLQDLLRVVHAAHEVRRRAVLSQLLVGKVARCQQERAADPRSRRTGWPEKARQPLR